MQPQSPDPKFDFMLKEQPQPKRSLGLPGGKLVKIGVAVAGLVIMLIIIGTVLSGRHKGLGQATSGVLARGQETLRVTALVQNLQLQDPTTQALAATVTSALSSDQAQIEDYLSHNHVKITKVELAADADKTTDAQMQSASQNSNLDQTYKAYLQQALTKYQTDLQTAYSSVGPNGKSILKDSIQSTNTLLTNPPLKT